MEYTLADDADIDAIRAKVKEILVALQYNDIMDE
jgi:hypothetical protein|tara:strand:+ start:895 stop:996 length:102 start_codon:yes stop_codon:yes gene_type:complete